MRAVRYLRYGPPDVLGIEQMAEPVPGTGQVGVRIEAASLNPLDWKLRAGALRFVPIAKAPPRTTGCDFAGVITAVGAEAGAWRSGDRVFGSLSPFGREGSCAEGCVVETNRIASIPDGIPFDVAACLPIAAGEAVQAVVDQAGVMPAQRVLIIGAAGGVGHFAVQCAAHRGASVAAVCGTDNVSFVQSLGAEQVVDYRAGDWRQALGHRFDAVFDVAGVLDVRASRRFLEHGGIYLSTAGTAAAATSTAIGGIVARWFGGTRASNVNLRMNAAALQRLADLARQAVLRPHIERRIGLEDVAEAQAAMQRGHGRGKIVVTP